MDCVAEVGFNVADGVLAEVKDARSENGIGFALDEDFGHVFEFACAATGDDGNAYFFADAACYDAIVAGLGAVGVDGVEDDFTSPEFPCANGPFNGVEACGFAAAVG